MPGPSGGCSWSARSMATRPRATGSSTGSRGGARSGCDGVELWTVETVNPDGVAAGTRGNAHGVDLNRNFPWSWRAIPPSSGYYSGPGPASEPETRAVRRLLRRVQARDHGLLPPAVGRDADPVRPSRPPGRASLRAALGARGARLLPLAARQRDRLPGPPAEAARVRGRAARPRAARRRGPPPRGGARRDRRARVERRGPTAPLQSREMSAQRVPILRGLDPAEIRQLRARDEFFWLDMSLDDGVSATEIAGCARDFRGRRAAARELRAGRLAGEQDPGRDRADRVSVLVHESARRVRADRAERLSLFRVNVLVHGDFCSRCTSVASTCPRSRPRAGSRPAAASATSSTWSSTG